MNRLKNLSYFSQDTQPAMYSSSYKRPRSQPFGRRAGIMTGISRALYRNRSGYNSRRSVLRNPNAKYTFERTVLLNIGFDASGNFLPAGGGAALGPGLAMSFSLSQVTLNWSGGTSTAVAVPNYAEFQTLFEKWKLNKVTCKWIGTGNVQTGYAGSGAALPVALPVMQYAPDMDDQTPPNSSAILLQYQDMRTMVFDTNGPKRCICKPKAVTSTEAGGVLATGYSEYSGYCDTVSSGVNWFGQKYWVEPNSVSASHVMNALVYVTYNITFKGVR